MRPNTTLLCTLKGLHYKYTPSLLNSRESLLVHLCCLHSPSMQAQVRPGHGRAAAHKVSASSLMQYRSTSSFTSHCSTKYPTAVLYVTLSVLCFTQEECSEAKITLHLRVQECFSWFLFWSTNTHPSPLTAIRKITTGHLGRALSFLFYFILF